MPAPTRKSAPAPVKTRGGPVAPVMIKGVKKSKTAVPSAAAAVPANKGTGKGKKEAIPVVQEDEDEDDEEDEEDEDFQDEASEDSEDDEDDDVSLSDASDASAEGTSEAGLKRLIEALGEDGLDEDELAELAALQDGEDDDDEEEEEEDEDEEDEEDEDGDMEEDIALPTNGSGSKDTLAASLARSGLIPQAVDDDDDEDEEMEDEDDDDEDEDPDASAIPLDSLDDAAYASLPDAVRSSRFHREKINNRPALTAVRDLIALDGPSSSASGSSSQKKMDWIEHMSLSWDHSVASELEAQGAAPSDDLKRELIFYKQALSAAQLGRQKVLAAGLPFSRPDDFFAEMVKSDSHMERVRQTLLDERAGIKASEEAKRQRELKKFGKKVQVQKGLERQKNKKEMEEKIQGLKRKRGGVDAAGETDGDDAFDIRIENALQSAASSSSSSARGRGRGGSSSSSRGDSRGRGRGGGAKMPRTARDDKFGFGGKKRFSKSNTRESTEAGYGKYEGAGRGGGVGGRGGRGGARGGRGGRGGSRGGSSRLGKSKRK